MIPHRPIQSTPRPDAPFHGRATSPGLVALDNALDAAVIETRSRLPFPKLWTRADDIRLRSQLIRSTPPFSEVSR